MKTRGIKDLYLPQRFAFHVKLLLFCAAFTLIWGFFIKNEHSSILLIGTFSVMFFDLEIVYFLLIWFKKLNKKYGQKILETSSIQKVVWINLIALLIFYIFFIALNTLGFSLFLIILHWIKGWEFPDLIRNISENRIIIVTAIALLFSIPIALFLKWLETLKKEYKLREQNLIFQNETLKNQVNPHFLFNSLNTLSSLVNNEVEVASQFITRLSLIYRYILDNSSKLEVPLKEEIEFIRDYYYLHQIRNEGKIKLEIDINSEEYAYKIIPISLQLLIENAIKHNMATQNKPLIIDVFIKDQSIVVKNNIQKMATKVESTKIGLKNLNERVRLFTGKEIIVEENENNFLVEIPLLT